MTEPSRFVPVAQPVHAAALPAFAPLSAPLSALILNAKIAFSGNCAVPGGDFITDGRTMLLRSACNETFLSKVKAAKCGSYGPENPVSTESSRKVFATTVQDAKYESRVVGYILGSSAGPGYESDQPYACIAGPGDRVSVANGHRVLFIQNITGANRVMASVDPRSQRLTFFRADEPVAVLMAMDECGLNETFLNMLERDRRANISVLAQNPARRVAG